MSTYDTPHIFIAPSRRDLVPAVRTLHQGKRCFSQKIAELAKLYLEEQAK